MLSGVTVSVTMNNENSWVLQPWHIKVSFRKCGYTVPEEAITIPYVIKGPDTNLEMKQFYVIIKVSDMLLIFRHKIFAIITYVI